MLHLSVSWHATGNEIVTHAASSVCGKVLENEICPPIKRQGAREVRMDGPGFDVSVFDKVWVSMPSCIAVVFNHVAYIPR